MTNQVSSKKSSRKSTQKTVVTSQNVELQTRRIISRNVIYSAEQSQYIWSNWFLQAGKTNDNWLPEKVMPIGRAKTQFTQLIKRVLNGKKRLRWTLDGWLPGDNTFVTPLQSICFPQVTSVTGNYANTCKSLVVEFGHWPVTFINSSVIRK